MRKFPVGLQARPVVRRAPVYHKVSWLSVIRSERELRKKEELLFDLTDRNGDHLVIARYEVTTGSIAEFFGIYPESPGTPRNGEEDDDTQ